MKVYQQAATIPCPKPKAVWCLILIILSFFHWKDNSTPKQKNLEDELDEISNPGYIFFYNTCIYL